MNNSAKLEIVCPLCHSSLNRLEDNGLCCSKCQAIYPKRAKVDVFLSDEEWESSLAELEEEKDILEKYSYVRRESPLNILYYDKLTSYMLEKVPADCEGPVLELMCGGAEICRRLPPCFKSAFALDMNVRMVEQAAEDLETAEERRVKCIGGTGTKLPFPDKSIGIVMIQGGLHHVKSILNEITSEIGRVLRPNGVLIALEPANDNWLIQKIRHWQYSRSDLQGNDPGEDGFTQQELTEALSTSGLYLDHYRPFGFLAYPLIGNTDLVPLLSKTRLMVIGHLLMGLDRFLEYIPVIRSLAWARIFRAVKKDK